MAKPWAALWALGPLMPACPWLLPWLLNLLHWLAGLLSTMLSGWPLSSGVPGGLKAMFAAGNFPCGGQPCGCLKGVGGVEWGGGPSSPAGCRRKGAAGSCRLTGSCRLASWLALVGWRLGACSMGCRGAAASQISRPAWLWTLCATVVAPTGYSLAPAIIWGSTPVRYRQLLRHCFCYTPDGRSSGMRCCPTWSCCG